MVLMTDGDNTENRWTSNATQIDARTTFACQSAKDAKIEVYTVRLMEGNATLLQNCASNSANYYNVQNSADLVPVFQAIGERSRSFAFPPDRTCRYPFDHIERGRCRHDSQAHTAQKSPSATNTPPRPVKPRMIA